MPATSDLLRYALAPLFGREAALVVFILILIWLVLFLMRTRRFYIVRHGETILNAQKIKQGPEGGLSEAGKRQAETVGAMLAPLHIERILASPYERAKETAEIIKKYLHVGISYSPLLAERQNPSAVVGKRRDDPEVIRILDQIDLSYHDDTYRSSDEENFIDLKKRAKQCLHYLAGQQAKTLCVVTHHAFLKMLLSYALYRERLHAEDYVKLSFFNASANGGVSIVEYHPWRSLSPTRGWEVVSYNETIQ
ncbi:histidine phosphatase family protein [Candidatus Kaiserbacteria bacterium]|nr:histidine phosphatase family protein [Candidatus Kaiserbacteria bacterium]